MRIQYADVPALLGPPSSFTVADTVPVPPDGSGYDWGVQGSGAHAEEFLSVQPDGSYAWRAAVGGSYERFKVDPDLNVLKVKPRVVVYTIPIKEV